MDRRTVRARGWNYRRIAVPFSGVLCYRKHRDDLRFTIVHAIESFQRSSPAARWSMTSIGNVETGVRSSLVRWKSVRREKRSFNFDIHREYSLLKKGDICFSIRHNCSNRLYCNEMQGSKFDCIIWYCYFEIISRSIPIYRYRYVIKNECIRYVIAPRRKYEFRSAFDTHNQAEWRQ